MKRSIFFRVISVILFVTMVNGCKEKEIVVTPAPPPAEELKPIVGLSYYVSTIDGSDANTGLTTALAFKTITKAISVAKSGDIVNLMNGTYSSTYGPVITLLPVNSGVSNGYITYKAYQGHTPKITASGNVWNAVQINASYIIFDGIEFEGNNANITLAAAMQSYNDAVAGTVDYSKAANFNTNGISIGGPRVESKGPVHVTIRNCKIHDFPGGGLSSIQADYTTFENNMVYNNAWYMMYAGSGISILCPINSDQKTSYKNYVTGNICHDNKTLVPWISTKGPSDGNGIILDVNQTPYEGGIAVGQGPYTGRTLVQNNLTYNNGGSGIHSYKADHVDIINNTAYNNGLVVKYANIFAGAATDVRIVNNIIYAESAGGGKCTSAASAGTVVTYSNNIYYNGTYSILGPNDKVANPQFKNLPADPTALNFSQVVDFSLMQASPAVNYGYVGLAPKIDIKGIARPMGAGVDCGAYESY